MKEISILELNNSIAELQNKKLELITAETIDKLKISYADFPELTGLLDTLCILSDERFRHNGILHRMTFCFGKEESIVKLYWFYGGGSYRFSWLAAEEKEEILLMMNGMGEGGTDKLLWIKLAEKLRISTTPVYAFIELISQIICDESIYRESLLAYSYDWDDWRGIDSDEAKLPMNQYAEKIKSQKNTKNHAKKTI